MKIKVLYHSMTGNTKKVAEAIAKVANVTAEAVTKDYKLSEPVDLLFIGDGIYAAQMNKHTKAFAQNADVSMVKHAAVFGTNGGQDKVVHDLVAMLKERDISVCDETFLCKGQAWIFANRNHPDQTDIDNATKFAKDIIKSIKNK